jgi:hypothetical protein
MQVKYAQYNRSHPIYLISDTFQEKCQQYIRWAYAACAPVGLRVFTGGFCKLMFIAPEAVLMMGFNVESLAQHQLLFGVRGHVYSCGLDSYGCQILQYVLCPLFELAHADPLGGRLEGVELIHCNEDALNGDLDCADATEEGSANGITSANAYMLVYRKRDWSPGQGADDAELPPRFSSLILDYDRGEKVRPATQEGMCLHDMHFDARVVQMGMMHEYIA